MQLVVVGTGLIGSSFALGARRRRLFDAFVGIEPDRARAERALALGVVDHIVAEVPAEADAVLLAGPSDRIAEWVERLSGHAGVVLDTGSIKGAIVDRVRARLGHLPARFVPAHPIAGSEQSGPDAADEALFRNHEVLLTPGRETDADAVALVRGWWESLGARVAIMDATRHDEVLAVTSHLPHLVAFAYLQQVEAEHLAHAGGGFRDFTRIAAADADMWAPIFALNRPALLAALDGLEAQLRNVRALVEQNDDPGLKALIERARRRRQGFANGR